MMKASEENEMTKPTIKPNKEMTHHSDGSVSFFNTMSGQWERGDVNAYLKAKRAAKSA
jgi:hypothetical protein